MTKKIVTAEDLEKLKLIEAAFSKNVIANYMTAAHCTKDDAGKVFKKNAHLKDIFKLITSKLRWESKLNGNAAPEKQAKALLRYCSSALPALKRSYGEDLLVRSLPKVAEEQGVIDICRAFGSNDIADLSEKARDLPPSTPPAGKYPTP